MDRLRLFVACGLPEDFLAFLSDVQQLLQAKGLPLRMVNREQMHLTLRFLGEVEAKHLPALQTWFAGLPLHFLKDQPCAQQGYGLFPAGRGQTLYAGMLGPPALFSLKAQAEEGLEALGFPREARAFCPHVTLGRTTGQARLQPEDLAALPVVEGGIILPHLTLYQSVLTAQGVTHRPLSRREE